MIRNRREEGIGKEPKIQTQLKLTQPKTQQPGLARSPLPPALFPPWPSAPAGPSLSLSLFPLLPAARFPPRPSPSPRSPPDPPPLGPSSRGPFPAPAPAPPARSAQHSALRSHSNRAQQTGRDPRPRSPHPFLPIPLAEILGPGSLNRPVISCSLPRTPASPKPSRRLAPAQSRAPHRGHATPPHRSPGQPAQGHRHGAGNPPEAFASALAPCYARISPDFCPVSFPPPAPLLTAGGLWPALTHHLNL